MVSAPLISRCWSISTTSESKAGARGEAAVLVASASPDSALVSIRSATSTRVLAGADGAAFGRMDLNARDGKSTANDSRCARAEI